MAHNAIRARVLPRFPAQVLAGNGITITRDGSVYIFAAAAYADIPLSALATIQPGRLIGLDGPDPGAPEQISVSGGLGFTGSGQLQLTPNQRLRGLVVPFTPPSVGAQFDVFIPVGCTIKSVTMLANPAGSVVVDIWKSTFAAFPPTVADSICIGAKPTITAAVKSQDSTLTGWSKVLTAGDILRFNVDSLATITRLMICLDAETL